jgi:hypothetical protein
MKKVSVSTKVVVALASCMRLGIAQAPCPEVTDTQRTKLVEYIHAKYKVPAGVVLDMAQTAVVNGSCYRKLEFKAQDQRRPFQLGLFASPDLRFLTPNLMDRTWTR